MAERRYGIACWSPGGREIHAATASAEAGECKPHEGRKEELL